MGLDDDKYVLELLQVPIDLTDFGYPGVVIDNQIQDKITELKESTPSN